MVVLRSLPLMMFVVMLVVAGPASGWAINNVDPSDPVARNYDVREVVDDEQDPDKMATWEMAVFYSRLFDVRSLNPDTNLGNDNNRIAWNKIYDCQPYDSNDICTYNLELNGKGRETVVAYTNNLWLGDVTFLVELERVDLPEPISAVLLALGLIIIMIGISSRPINCLRMKWQQWFLGY